MKSNLTTLKAELLDEAFEFFNENPSATEIRDFISNALDRAIREAVVGFLPKREHTPWCGRDQCDGCDDDARAEVIERAKSKYGIEL